MIAKYSPATMIFTSTGGTLVVVDEYFVFAGLKDPASEKSNFTGATSFSRWRLAGARVSSTFEGPRLEPLRCFLLDIIARRSRGGGGSLGEWRR